MTKKLAEVTAARDRHAGGTSQPLDSRNLSSNDHEGWETQCQRYEERIVELHSVIAELSKKLEVDRGDTIPEESECYATDSCLEEEEETENEGKSNQFIEKFPLSTFLTSTKHLPKKEIFFFPDNEAPYDHDSLAFEKSFQDQEYKIELFDELQAEVVETRGDNERLRQALQDKDKDLNESKDAIGKLEADRDSLRRQLEDLQNTLEYQVKYPSHDFFGIMEFNFTIFRRQKWTKMARSRDDLASRGEV